MKTLQRAVMFNFFVILAIGVCGQAQAGQYDLKEMTPAISAAIQNRQSNYEDLQTLKMKNQVGENNRGYVELLGEGGASDLVASENRSRKVIYQAIANQNELGSAGFEIIEKVFAEVQLEKARAGESVQRPNGEWIRKS